MAAAAALVEGEIAQAEALLRAHLKRFPTDVAAIRMLAEVLRERCLELARSFHPARHQYAIVLQRQNKAAAALRQLDRLEQIDPRAANAKVTGSESELSWLVVINSTLAITRLTSITSSTSAAN